MESFIRCFLEAGGAPGGGGGSARPNPGNRVRMFSDFVHGSFLFGAHVAGAVLFLLLFFAARAGWFPSLILATLAVLPVGIFLERSGLFYRLMTAQFIVLSVAGLGYYLIRAF